MSVRDASLRRHPAFEALRRALLRSVANSRGRGMHVGVFGGTFDPVHLGHLVIAEQCREQTGLDQVWFVPAARPPHKPRTGLTPFERRAEMLRLAVAGNPAFRVNEIEHERTGPSFTVDTLAE